MSTNPKFQAPNPNELPKSQFSRGTLRGVDMVGRWQLGVPWDLELGAWDLSSLSPSLPQEPDEIPVRDVGVVFLGVTPLSQQPGNLLQIGDRFDVRRTLLAAEGAVEVRSDHAVARV